MQNSHESMKYYYYIERQQKNKLLTNWVLTKLLGTNEFIFSYWKSVKKLRLRKKDCIRKLHKFTAVIQHAECRGWWGWNGQAGFRWRTNSKERKSSICSRSWSEANPKTRMWKNKLCVSKTVCVMKICTVKIPLNVLIALCKIKKCILVLICNWQVGWQRVVGVLQVHVYRLIPEQAWHK